MSIAKYCGPRDTADARSTRRRSCWRRAHRTLAGVRAGPRRCARHCTGATRGTNGTLQGTGSSGAIHGTARIPRDPRSLHGRQPDTALPELCHVSLGCWSDGSAPLRAELQGVRRINTILFGGAMAPSRGSATDIVIAGAGPVGLVLACELRRRDVGCRLIDKVIGFPRTSRANALQPRSMEVLRVYHRPDDERVVVRLVSAASLDSRTGCALCGSTAQRSRLGRCGAWR